MEMRKTIGGYDMGDDQKVSFEKVEFEIFIGPPSRDNFIEHWHSKEHSE